MTELPDPDLEAARARCAEFKVRWQDFVRRWQRADRKDPARGRRLVARALSEGLIAEDDVQTGRPTPPAQVEWRCAAAVISASGAFDVDGYRAANRAETRRTAPLRHFVEQGWRDLRAPSLAFDLWWYWCTYLDPTAEEVNPLLHYLLVGRHAPFDPRPSEPAVRPGTTYAPGFAPRRACLYAAYDRDGRVDDYVVDFVRELSRHADVFYLADGVLEQGELQRLDGIVEGAWSIPHAAYDFGSWSMLARDLVGWQRLDEYDEVILANDSCFLVRPLDAVFATMDARTADWWSLQATSMEFNEDDVGVGASMPLGQAVREFVGPRRWSDTMYLHLSSYFLVLRRPVVADAGFRYRLDAVCGQRTKQLVVDKYEVGISRYLMDSGYPFDTWVDGLPAFHPLYSPRAFDLIGAGFPLVKRNFLAENPRDVPDFADWPERLLAAAPEAPLETIRANIERVSPHDRIRRGLEVTLDAQTGRRVRPPAPWGAYSFRWVDDAEPKHPHWWAFPVAADTHRLSPGARAVFETVRNDPSIHKAVITRSRPIDLDGENVEILPLGTRATQKHVARCREILLDRTPRAALDLPLTRGLHHFVHLGGGLPVGPGPFESMTRGSSGFKALSTDFRRLNAMVVASRADALAKAASTPLNLHQLWLTGLPRQDLVTWPFELLPEDLQRSEAQLRAGLGDRRLVVFWPRPGRPARHFSEREVHWLLDWSRRSGAVLGVREAAVDRVGSLSQQLMPSGAWGLSARSVPEPSVVLRVASVVVTDDADDAVDFLLTGRPLVHYGTPQVPDVALVGHYPPEEVLPGPFCRTFDDLSAALETVFDPCDPARAAIRARALRLVSGFTDGLNAWRLVERIRRQYVDG